MMKQRIYIGLIIILLLAVGITQYFILINNKSNNEGVVKSEQIDKSNFTLENFDVSTINLAPKKKNTYIKPKVWAKNYIIIDVHSACQLANKDADMKTPIASTTKIMTAIIVLENYNLNDIITVSKNAAHQIGSDVYLRTEEEISVKNLLYALLIKSGNDAAMALAEKMGKDEFITKMNEKANYLGLDSTHFKDPAGLDDTGYSTARDLAILAAYALRNDEFKNIIRMSEAVITSSNGKISHKLESSNRLIKPNEPLFYSEAIGVKTGFTPDAGHCLIAAAQKENHLLVSVILSTYEDSKEASARESRKLLQWGFNNYSWTE